MKTIKHYQVTCERLADGWIPQEVKIREFYGSTMEWDAQDYFRLVCDDLCYPWVNCIESNKDYLIIAQAGGINCDYRLLLTAHYA